MKALFIGGTGTISTACSKLAIEKGIELYHLNRGRSKVLRPVDRVTTLNVDIRNIPAVRDVLKNQKFDVVVDWVSFTPDHILNAIELFRGNTAQYIFISSASCYQTPPDKLPVTEDTPLENPFWQYSRDKIACEEELQKAYAGSGFPYTIVRPSHTYDETRIPLIGNDTAYARLKAGKPVVVHGDGTSIWTLTNSRDFAIGFTGLLGRDESIGEAYHITSDEWLTWNQIYDLFARTLGVRANIVHIPSEVIAGYDAELGAGLLGDKSQSMIFDNSKIKEVVPDYQCKIPFGEGVKEIVAWQEADLERLSPNTGLDQTFERILNDYIHR